MARYEIFREKRLTFTLACRFAWRWRFTDDAGKPRAFSANEFPTYEKALDDAISDSVDGVHARFICGTKRGSRFRFLYD